MSDLVRFNLADGMDLAGVGIREVWWRYAALGGSATLELVTDRINGAAECDDLEHDLIAQVLNEVFIDHGVRTFPVGYNEPYRALPTSPIPFYPVESGQHPARRRAAEARRRSAEAARHAAELQLTAARLMQASGQLRLAGRAHTRAFNAFVRSRRADARSAG